MITPVATLKQLLEARVKENPENLFLILEGYSLSYSEFQRQVYQVANGFLRLGVKKGERIGIFLPNCPEFLFIVFAAAELGAVFVPINTAFTVQEARYVLNHSESSFLITTKHFLPLIEQIRGTCPSLSRVISIEKGNEPEVLEWNEFLYGATNAAPGTVVQPADLASITYTSGTTDRPKGVMLTQYAYCFAPQKRAEALGWNERDRAIVMMPLFHVNALCHMAIAMFSVGGSILLKDKFSASSFWNEVREYQVTTSSLMRTIPQILLNLPEKPDDGSTPFRLAVALLPPEQHLRFEERFHLTAVPSYSLTEDILSVIGPLDKSKRKIGSCGLPIVPEVHKLWILNEKGEECPPGELGEIVKQSPTVMKGYYKNPEATADVLRDGWLYTGDVGYRDEEGFLYFVDRKKDMVKRGDENISPEEVERVLNSHPLIAESAVIGIPDPIRQEEVKAYVALKPPSTPESLAPEEIWAFCQKHLAPFKVPRYLEYRQELPKTPSGKVRKTPLRAEGGSLKQEVFDRLARNKKNA